MDVSYNCFLKFSLKFYHKRNSEKELENPEVKKSLIQLSLNLTRNRIIWLRSV